MPRSSLSVRRGKPLLPFSVHAESVPACFDFLHVFRSRADGRRVTVAVSFGLIIQVDGRVRQNPGPLAGAEQMDVRIAPTDARVETGAPVGGIDDDIAFADFQQLHQS